MTGYSLEEVVNTVEGQQTGQASGKIREILTDSRRIVYPEGALFVALRGPRHDGHQYIPVLYRHQVKYFLVDHFPEDIENYPEGCFILVEDTLRALQLLAGRHRKTFTKPLIVITGSNGKTIVKEWLVQTLSGKKYVVRSPKSYNSQVGVPLSLWLLDNSYDYGIIEAGISRPEEMKRLEKIIRPDIGILTNIGEAHQEHFSSLKKKLQEKLSLFDRVGTLIYRKDIQWIDREIRERFKDKEITLFTWAVGEEADLQITEIVKTTDSSEIRAIFRQQKVRISIPFTDEASVENAIHVWATLLYLQCEQEHISRVMRTLRPVAMRMEIKKGTNHCLLINDYYNSDLQSLTIALDFLKQQNRHPKKTVILSDILQSGKPKEDLYRDVARLVRESRVDRFIGIGQDVSAYVSRILKGSLFFPGTEAFLHALPSLVFRDEVILLKGARDFHFEEISARLEEQVHQTVLEVDLDALVHNLNVYRMLLQPETRMMVMVKAFAYGSGGYEVARTLEYQQVDYLAVAYADEGVMLRQSGIKLPVMIMNPEVSAFDPLIRFSLEPELFNLEILEAFIQKLEAAGIRDYPVHLKIDTGMHRLGFLPEETEKLIHRISGNSSLYIRSVFSHLAASEAPDHDDFTRQQIRVFKEVAGKIQKALGYNTLWHILNSAGIERFPEAQFDMVRPGLGIYGISENLQDRLQNVSSFRSIVTQVKNIKPGESIGYGRSEIAEKNMTIAVVPVGYADGLKRNLSNRKGKLYVKGSLVPIVGKICMDMCMIDVTGLDVKAGDAVEIFGEHIPITGIAQAAGTIPYEILTGISSRVKRTYIQE